MLCYQLWKMQSGNMMNLLPPHRSAFVRNVSSRTICSPSEPESMSWFRKQWTLKRPSIAGVSRLWTRKDRENNMINPRTPPSSRQAGMHTNAQYLQILPCPSSTLCAGYFAASYQLSNMGANVGTPLDSRRYTTVRVTLGLEITKTASAPEDRYRS
jgi:hypothetical protein